MIHDYIVEILHYAQNDIGGQNHGVTTQNRPLLPSYRGLQAQFSGLMKKIKVYMYLPYI